MQLTAMVRAWVSPETGLSPPRRATAQDQIEVTEVILVDLAENQPIELPKTVTNPFNRSSERVRHLRGDGHRGMNLDARPPAGSTTTCSLFARD
jgi:hypothetical protein